MLQRALLVASASLALLLLPVHASTVEEATVGVVAYQFDGNTFHDAPDGCGDADPAWSLAVGSSTDGILAPPDDSRDAFVVDVPDDMVGHRLHLGVTDPTDTQPLTLDAFAPGCTGSILDAVNWPHAEPAPPAPAAGEKQVSPPLAPDYCHPDGWVFVFSGMKGLPAPATMYAAWTDGSEHAVDLAWARNGYVAYSTADGLAVTLKGAWANLAQSWSGQAWLAGPCDATDGGAVYGDQPTVDLGAIAFTPVHAGPHVVIVSWMDGALPSIHPPAAIDLDPTLIVEPHEIVQDPQGSAQELVGTAQSPPPPQDLLPRLVVPASCHFCLHQVEDGSGQVSYNLTSRAN
jgi:hypothetical protein